MISAPFQRQFTDALVILRRNFPFLVVFLDELPIGHQEYSHSVQKTRNYTTVGSAWHASLKVMHHAQLIRFANVVDISRILHSYTSAGSTVLH